jgi:hypothetical protein
VKIRTAVGGALVGTMALLGTTAAPALGAPSSNGGASGSASVKPHVSQVDPTVTFDGAYAHVTGTFRCPDNGQHLHVWVSVKQGEDVKAHSTSQDASAWYDAHPGEDPGTEGTVPCDGAWHTATYALNNEFGELQAGSAWIQFCLVNESEIVTSMSRWGTVVDEA